MRFSGATPVFGNPDADRAELLPAGGVGHPDHEVVFAGVDVRRNGNPEVGFIDRFTGGNRIVLVEYPGVDRLFYRILPALSGFRAVGVMVEVVVDFQIERAQLHVIGEDIGEGQEAAAGEFLAVERGREFAAGEDFGRDEVLFPRRAAARTECAQQQGGKQFAILHDARVHQIQSHGYALRPVTSAPRGR
jgi:hypothetical protein